MSSQAPLIFDGDAVRAGLSARDCIGPVRDAMIALSNGQARQLLRSFVPLGEGRILGQMPAALSIGGYFGAKIVSVFSDPDNPGRRTHEGIVVLFEGERGRPICIADAHQITAIRTGAASAAATDALARPDASVLALLGAGVQAQSHLDAIACVRKLGEVRVWSRTPASAAAFAKANSIRACASAEEAIAGADIICTLTTASEPILKGAWVKPGVHINAVGSSVPGPVEVDNDLVAKSRYFADHREHVLAHGAEFLRAKQAGLIDDAHILAEIGEVLAGAKPGRTSDADITFYKSLGHAVQDLAATAWLYEHRS